MPPLSPSAGGGGSTSVPPLTEVEANAIEGLKLGFVMPSAVPAGSVMRVQARVQQHQLPFEFQVPEDGLVLAVPFRVPDGGFVRGGQVLQAEGRDNRNNNIISRSPGRQDYAPQAQRGLGGAPFQIPP